MIILRKILIQDYDSLIRSAFAEDLDLLTLYAGNPASALDVAFKDFKEAIDTPNSVFFSIENQYAVFAGFFALNMPATMMNFHLRKTFRTDTYKTAFWNLVNETLNNELYTSIGSSNLTSLLGILSNTFVVKNQLEYHGKNFVLLKDII